ncbi:Transmembrane protein [Parasponia andersonii]|uniref:Transmembrane protein n=1 Tax=Parasponia andersonii TaxID=3476 RepID=A0A2P5B935_PARAD|nr:Transmembrane protein [Parasponia andersonii]
MDSIKAQKLQAMNCYNKRSQFLYNLILSSLVAITCSFLCSYPFWFSSLTSSIKHLVFISLPNICSSFLNPKCLFIVFNVIVAFLVGESKLLSSQSSPTTDIYSDYVERSRSLRGQRDFTTTDPHEEKKEERKLEIDVNKESENRVYEDKEVVLIVAPNEERHDEKLLEEEEKFQEAENNDDYDDQQEKDGEEESEGLPTDELNKRVEEFIARINKQRWLEARMLICSQA